MKFREEVQRFIACKRLFSPSSKLLVALSGGADSVALLRVLVELGYTCEAAHCNFHLRGEESDRDEAFVRQLCEQLSVPLHVTHFDTQAHAREHQQSIEMAARELRYGWFQELVKQRKLNAIVVGHHRDDNVETLLINLIRGTGINGLTGIPAENGWVRRPLLNVSREQILDYLDHLGQPFVTDSTNLEDEYLRNKIRLNLLPMLEELNPSIRETLSDTISHLEGVANVYHLRQEGALKQIVRRESANRMNADIGYLLADPYPQALLYEWLYPLGFNPSQINDICNSLYIDQPGKRFFSKEWEVLRDRRYLMVRRLSGTSKEPELEIKVVEITPSFQIPTDKGTACVDADKITLPFTVRKWKRGDSFVPFGMQGKQNVCKYMTDHKFSLFQKDNQYLLVSGGKVVWLIGERIDNRFRLTEHSQRALIIRVKQQ